MLVVPRPGLSSRFTVLIGLYLCAALADAGFARASDRGIIKTEKNPISERWDRRGLASD